VEIRNRKALNEELAFFSFHSIGVKHITTITIYYALIANEF
jgi:hypothetical protein